MDISQFLSSSFLIPLIIIIVLSSILFGYISYRISEQDHKISSMLGLISTMAQELDFFRNRIANKGGSMMMPSTKSLETNPTQLIEVSDEDCDDDDDEDDDDDDEDDDEDDDDRDEDEEEDGRNVKILNIHLGNGELNIENEIEEISEQDDDDDADGDNDHDDDDDDDDDDEDDDDNFSQETKHLVEIVPESTSKTLHISGFDESIEMDYKKMSIGKLRTLVVEKGLSNDSSKLKKAELLQLLSSV